MVSTMTTSPGWYDDGHGAIRWWDGNGWTKHVAAPAAAPAVGQPAAAPAVGQPPVAQPVGQPAAAQPVEQPTGPTEPMNFSPPASVAAPAPPSAPAGYPGAYSAQSGVYAAPAEPRKSKAWIVWLILGVVVLGFVIAVAFLTPLLIGGFADEQAAPTSDASTAPSPTVSPTAPDDRPPSAADEQAAVAAVEVFNEAWLTADCDDYFATTTESYRELTEVTDCDTFTFQARGFAGSVDDFRAEIRDVEAIGSAVSVSTTETYMSRYDADGNETAEPQQYSDRYEYVVVSDDGHWAIDESYAD